MGFIIEIDGEEIVFNGDDITGVFAKIINVLADITDISEDLPNRQLEVVEEEVCDCGDSECEYVKPENMDDEICECGDEYCTYTAYDHDVKNEVVEVHSCSNVSYVGCDFGDKPDITSWTTISSTVERIEMDKDTFVTLVEAIEQHQSVIMDVKELIRNTDGHTYVFDYLPDTMIKFLDEELETDLVSMYFFELELEVPNASALYDFIMDSRKCC